MTDQFLRIQKQLTDRFNQKWEPTTETGCWLWTASSIKHGYGRILSDGRLHLAHRVSWELHKGKIPTGMQVCHKCDTPACVNPEHLFLGTHADNMQDRRCKGRSPNTRGSRNGRARIAEQDIPDIRTDRRTHRAIADFYGVSEPSIYKIKNRLTWRHVQ